MTYDEMLTALLENVRNNQRQHPPNEKKYKHHREKVQTGRSIRNDLVRLGASAENVAAVMKARYRAKSHRWTANSNSIREGGPKPHNAKNIRRSLEGFGLNKTDIDVIIRQRNRVQARKRESEKRHKKKEQVR